MSKHHVLFIIGVAIIFLPFIGIPYAFKSILILLAGVSVCFLTVFLHVEKRTSARRVTRSRKKIVTLHPEIPTTSEGQSDYQAEVDVPEIK